MKDRLTGYWWSIKAVAAYVAIATTLFIVVMVAYDRTRAEMTEAVVSRARAGAVSGLAQYEFSMECAYSLIKPLAQETWLKRLGGSGATDSYLLYVAKRTLGERFTAYAPISDLFLMARGSDYEYLISGSRVTQNLSDAFERGLLYLDGMDEKTFAEALRANVNQGIHSGNYIVVEAFKREAIERAPARALIYPLALPGGRQQNTSALLLIDADSLERALINGASELCVLVTCNGRTLISRAFPEELRGAVGTETSRGGGYSVFAVDSASTGLRVSVALPDTYIASQLSRFRQIYYVLLIVTLALLALMIAMLINRFVSPAARLARRVGVIDANGGGMEQIARRVEQLQQSNHSLSAKLDSWEPMLKRSCIEKLLREDSGHPVELGELKSLEQSLAGKYHVGVFLFDGELTGEALDSLAGRLTGVAPNECAAQISVIDARTLVAFMRRGAPLAELPEGWTGGISGEHEGVGEARAAYLEAVDSLTNARVTQGSLAAYDEIELARDDFSLQYLELEKLSNLLSSGRGEEAVAFLEALSRENFPRERLSAETVKRFYYDLKGVLIRVSRQTDASVAHQFPAIHDGMTAGELARECAPCFIRAADAAQLRMDMSARSVSMLQYIDEHFTRQDMSLKLLSQEFNMTEKAVSLYFNDKTGFMFSEYLETLRLKRAAELLYGGALSQSEISLAVGYASVDTFSRAFKRNFGLTPLHFRSLVSGPSVPRQRASGALGSLRAD